MSPAPERPPVIHEGLPTQLPDIDPDETQEWVESLDALLDERGRDRARYVMLKLLERARERQVGVPALRSTDYINTIPPEREPWFPGNEHIERRIRAFIRWNAAVMVSRRQPQGPRGRRSHRDLPVRGQPVRGRLQPLLPRSRPPRWRRPGLHPGPRLPRHLRPRLPRGQAGRDPAGAVPPGGAARQGRRTVVVPAPAADAGLLGVPHGLHGAHRDQLDLPGPVQPLPAQPRHQGDRPAARLGVPRRRRDGRARVAGRDRGRRPGGAGQPHVRRQLQPAAARRARTRQRQDHPGARVVLPRRRLERHQGGVGPGVGRPARPRHRRHARQPDERHARRAVPDVQRRGGQLHPGALLRRRPAAEEDGPAPVRRRPAQAPARRARLPQGLCRVRVRAQARRASRR